MAAKTNQGNCLVARAINIADLRRLADRRLPRVVFDYLDGGAEAEFTLRENCRAFEDIIFRPRQAIAGQCDLRTRILGSNLSFPLILAPIGYTRLIHPSGELAVARAAEKAGIGYVVATFAGYKLEEVRTANSGALWYQLYLIGGREAAEAGIERARKAGFSALVICCPACVEQLFGKRSKGWRAQLADRDRQYRRD